MFDKVNLKGRIDVADIGTVVLKNYLEECAEGDEVFYRSTSYAHLSGVWIEIRGSTIRCKCSVHKLWSKWRGGKLDNSRPMTFAMAVRTIRELLMNLCMKAHETVVTYYEVGLTMRLSVEAVAVIEQVDEAGGRVLWNDANYPKYRQKTSEKSKYYRKVMKIYDKSFEASEKGKRIESNILRIETIYKHQNIRLDELLSKASLEQIGRIFYKDWSGLRFYRELRPTAGVKLSELVKARELHRLGVERFKNKYRDMWRKGELSKKQWETFRVYASRWDSERGRYVEVVTEIEKEYKEKLLAGFQVGKTVPFR